MMWVRIGALLMAGGISLGAFGAHGLKDTLDPARMELFKTAVFYHLINALGLVLVGTLSLQSPSRSRLFPSGSFLTAGIVLFSGSLYLIAVNGMTGLALVTPVGGICLAAGWIFLIFTL
jgi:uncharacterized membrane protein YgdD (TMEM256/DUF423 family)